MLNITWQSKFDFQHQQSDNQIDVAFFVDSDDNDDDKSVDTKTTDIEF